MPERVPNEPFTLPCPRCGMEHERPALPQDSVACCVRCGGELERASRLGSNGVLALSLAAGVCWLLAAWFPLASVRKLGLSNDIGLLAIGSSFRADGQPLLALLTHLTAVALPSLLFAALPILALAEFRGGQAARWERTLRIGDFARRWAMPEVFVLAILVAFTKIDVLAEARLEMGFWFLCAAVALQLAALQAFVPLTRFRALAASREPARGARQARPWALMIAAVAMLAPANLLPVMTVGEPGGHATPQTILSGIAKLAEGGMWGIAAIVFIASILVPFTKLGGLAWLMFLARRQAGNRRAGQAYRFLDFIGRWSMLDIFLIGFLAGLIDFGPLASVNSGPAAPAFAAAVALTALAVESFDTRALWNSASALPDHETATPT